jgi:diaminopimelate epimerase
MKLRFFKFHGAGNDFVMIDNRESLYKLSAEEIALLCHRRFGIGADGLMLLEYSSQYDFEMKYYNSDGLEGSMCGNGGRCIVAFANMLGIEKEEYHFMAVDGLHQANILRRKNDLWDVSLQMIDVASIEKNEDSYFMNTGSPHHVEFVDDVQRVDVYSKGKAIRNNEFYAPKGGTNVNFISVSDDDIIYIRTYERGVEEETLACGTGVTAAAIAAAIESKSDRNDYQIKALGGDLNVRFVREGDVFTQVWLRGPAALVFYGEFELL